jgi:hypothetical protein
MNGLEFAKATTAGGFGRVLIHAAPAKASIEVRTDDDADAVVVSGDLDRDGEYSPMTLLELNDGDLRREEIWPDRRHIGLPVLLAGGEVGLLRHWEHADDHSWWQWQIEFANHVGRPHDWSPELESDGQK